MKIAKLLLVMLFSIAVAACGGGGDGSSTGSAASTAISATATTTAQNLTVGAAMSSFSPLTPSGGATPYTYSHTGTIPAGLSFNASTGAVTGTPTAAYATASLVFSVQDANNVVASTTSSVNFSVGAAGPISATATTTAQSLTVGTAMTSFSPLIPSGGATPYTYSHTGTLPAGLSFNASTGAVTGTPTATYATASLVFSVKDANNNYANTTSTVSFNVSAATAALASSYNLTGVTANGITLGGNLIAPVTITAAQSIDGKAHTYYYWDVSGDGTSAGVDKVTHDLLDQIFNGGTLGDSFYDTTDAPSSNTVTLSNGVTIHLPTKAELSALFTAKPPDIFPSAQCGPPSWGTMRDFYSATLDQVDSWLGGSFHFYSVKCSTIFDSSYNQLGIDDSFPRSAAFEVVPASFVVQGGLTWMPVTFYDNFTNANAYCAKITINGQSGWRLPTQAELSALYASGEMNGQGWTLDITWSSTVYSAGNHYGVYLDNGVVLWYSDIVDFSVSCVR